MEPYCVIFPLTSLWRTKCESYAFRSHLEKSPAEFVELKIWASSESSPEFGRALWQSHSNRAPSVHLQDKCRSKSERVVVDSGRLSTQCSTNLPYFGLAPSIERHKLDRTSTVPRLNTCSMGKFGRGGVTRSGPLYWEASCQRGAKSLEKLAALWLRLKLQRGVSDS